MAGSRKWLQGGRSNGSGVSAAARKVVKSLDIWCGGWPCGELRSVAADCIWGVGRVV